MFTGTFVGNELENSKSDWEANEKGASPVAFRRIYAEMAGTALAGLVLSQTVYWHKRSKETGKIRLQVFRDGHYWLAKSRRAWWDECCATPNEARGAIKVLSNSRKLKHGVLAGIERLPLIEVAKWKFGSQGNAAPTTHIRIVWENFLPLFELTKQKLEEEARSVKSTDRIGEIHQSNGEIPRSNGEIHKSLTETTTESTSKITKGLKALSTPLNKNGKSAVSGEAAAHLQDQIPDHLKTYSARLLDVFGHVLRFPSTKSQVSQWSHGLQDIRELCEQRDVGLDAIDRAYENRGWMNADEKLIDGHSVKVWIREAEGELYEESLAAMGPLRPRRPRYRPRRI